MRTLAALLVLLPAAGCFRVGFFGDGPDHADDPGGPDEGGGDSGAGDEDGGDGAGAGDAGGDVDVPVFTILGVRGGLDVVADATLTSGEIAVVDFTTQATATGYVMSIRDADGTAEVCPAATVAAGESSHTFLGCVLT